ncbi:M3 family oligoendopeptidase [Desulfolithobacter sp.]
MTAENRLGKQEDNVGAIGVLWSLEDLYQGVDDPALEEDMELCRREAAALAQKYGCQVGRLDAGQLLELITRLEQLDERLGRLATYSFLHFTTHTGDPQASALLQRVEELAAGVGRQTIFFRLEWNRLDREKAETLLGSDMLEKYRHYLASLRRFAPHQLDQAQEELLQELAPVGRSSWNVLFEKLLGQMTFGERRRTEEEVLSDLYHPDRTIRRQAAAEMTEGLQQHLHILTHIFNTLAAEKMIQDRLRSYPSWISSMNLENELRDATVDTLVGAVTSRYDIVHRYYELKREILGLKRLYDYDRYAPVPGLDEGVIPWQQCRRIVVDSFASFSVEMAEIAERFFQEKWIHAPVLPGKRGGAFAHPCVPDVHPYVMVNYLGTLRDVSTVAHELGHGIHQFLAARQGYYNSDTPLVLAETASVFAELLVFRAQLELLESREARRAFICQKLESIFATVFRQVAMNRFEDAMHRGRREQGELSPDQLSAFWLATQKPMFGDSVELREEYGIWWSYIPHFLGTPGYVYSYAFGELLVLALYGLYQEQGEGFVDRYLKLLTAGGSSSPYELLQPFGIDLDDSAFWHRGLDIIEQMLEELSPVR